MLRNSLWLALALLIALGVAARAQITTLWGGSLRGPIVTTVVPPACGPLTADFTVPCNAVLAVF